MTRLFGVLAALALYSSYSYSEIVHNTTQNAAASGQEWVMSNIIPQYTGLTINSVTYQYTTMKNAQDQMVVSIQNKSVGTAGYIFRSVDDWSGLPGNTISKNVPVLPSNAPYKLWGDGQIAVEGQGLVVDPSVFYNYSYDPCNDNPLYSPNCPGYAAALAKQQLDMIPEMPSVVVDQNESYDNANVLPDYYNEDEEMVNKDRDLDAEERERRKKLGIKAAENTLTQANQISQSQLIDVMNYTPGFQNYYVVAIAGGLYKDNDMYKPKNLPENKKGLRVGLAQQLMHEKMIEEQYNRK